MKRILAYIAGPISKGDLAHNINQATEAFMKLAKAGLAPFCPHWSAFSGGCQRFPVYRGGSDIPTFTGEVYAVASVAGNPAMTHDDWLAVDLAWVRVSDALLRLPGESKGADREVWEATYRGIPVFEDIDQLIRWAQAQQPEAA